MGLLVKFGCSLYVDLRRVYTHMTHIGSQCREPGVDILAIVIPFKKAMNCKSVPQIVNTWSTSFAFMDTAFVKENTECLIHCTKVQTATS